MLTEKHPLQEPLQELRRLHGVLRARQAGLQSAAPDERERERGIVVSGERGRVRPAAAAAAAANSRGHRTRWGCRSRSREARIRPRSVQGMLNE